MQLRIQDYDNLYVFYHSNCVAPKYIFWGGKLLRHLAAYDDDDAIDDNDWIVFVIFN
jgi:hypothetical protein